MISQLDLTYNRYYQAPGSFKQTQVPALLKSDEVKPKSPTYAPDLPVGSVGDQLRIMVDRLNNKSEHFHSNVTFELNINPKRPPVIDMKSSEDGSLLGQYNATQIIDLERNLYHMSGFHLSVEG